MLGVPHIFLGSLLKDSTSLYVHIGFAAVVVCVCVCVLAFWRFRAIPAIYGNSQVRG